MFARAVVARLAEVAGRLGAQPFRSIEASRFFSLAGFSNPSIFGEETLPAQATPGIGRHRDVRQFRAPAAAFRWQVIRAPHCAQRVSTPR